MGILTNQRNAERPKALFEFTQGVDVDARLASHEVRVQKAWAKALAQARILDADEAAKISGALDEALSLIRAGGFEWRVEDEDVHMNLERFVTEKAGSLGKKMHTGRSRNDLIATTLRLFVHASVSETAQAVRQLALALVQRAEKDLDVLVPGLTHVQHGQPIRHGHVLAGHAWAFARDLERLQIAATRALAAMPLGAAALAGTTLELDFSKLARDLGFASPCLNSYDAVGDRDFMIEAIDAFASVALHLSRLSEDCIYWSSTAVGLVKLPKDWSTGSSIMPNKRNPDVPELTRGKSAHVIAAATNAHALVKALPTSYDSDLHELKGVYLRAFDQLGECLAVFPYFVAGLEPDPAKAERLLKTGHILATEVADELARNGVPFREAYAQVAALVERAEAQGVQIEDLGQSDWAKHAPKLPADFPKKLGARSAVERRSAPGGTSLAQAQAGIAALKDRLAGT